LNAILFVQFKDAKEAEPLGFSTDYPYPVYHVDAVDNDDGSLSAQLLLANREGEFHWVDQSQVRRVKGQSQGNQGRKNGGNRRFSKRPVDGNRRDPKERFGDSQYHPQYKYQEG